MSTSLLTRKVNTRQTRTVHDQELNDLKSEIKTHIDDIKDKTQLRALFNNSTNSDEVKIKEFISRAQIVWICATLDYYLHKIQSICIFKVYNKQIPQTSFCNKVKVPLDIVIDLSNRNSTTFIEGVYESLKNYSYININTIEDIAQFIGIDIKSLALSLYPSEPSMKKAYNKMSSNFKEIFERRHVIAHKMDIISGGQPQPITDALVDLYIDEIEKFIFKFHENVEHLI